MNNPEGQLTLASGQTGELATSKFGNVRFTLQIEGAGVVTVRARMAGAETFALINEDLASGLYSSSEAHLVEALQFTAALGAAKITLAGGAA